ncbi:MAG: hypothetical protein QXX17_07765 [Conexivisphaerales archaeon]
MNKSAAIAIIAVLVVAVLAGAGLLLSFSARHSRSSGNNFDVIADYQNASPGRGLVRLPYPFFGAGGVGSSKLSSNPQLLSLLLSSGIAWTRVEAQLPLVFPTPSSMRSPDYSSIDAELQAATSAGFSHIIILVDYTPPWLINDTGFPCLTAAHYPPSNFTEWGELASMIVQHIYSKFNLPSYYIEIWNEPDAAKFLCVNPSEREATYFSIFKAAAVAISNEVNSSRVILGGPALANPVRDAKMIYDFVHDEEIAGYIGFVSYHQYSLASSNDTWLGNQESVLQAEQSPITGYAAVYINISNIVHHGLQPDPANTPVFITEYNSNAVLPGCCGNSPVYAPLYNALVVSDLFQTVRMNGSDGSLPAGIIYFTLSSPTTGACMFGTWDAQMDCSTSGPIQPYPSFYLYQLIASSNYLGVAQGSYLPAYSTKLSNLTLTFLPLLSDKSFSLVIVNPYQNSVKNVSILFKNLALQTCPARAWVYTIVNSSSNESIESSQLQTASNSQGCSVVMSQVPGYSVLAISLPRG